MNKQDKQFEQMMKGIRIDSPSSDFTVRVMSRIQAEAAVQKRSVIQDYQPVISKRTWIILLVIFVLFMIYITVSGQDTTTANNTGIWSTVSGKLAALNTKEVSKIWQTGTGLFTSIPPVVFLILTASLALWTLDLFFTRFKHNPSHV